MELYRDIINAPHTLIAGTTGSGKSNVLNGIIREVMETKSPDKVKLILIDPKRVELSQYRNTEFCADYTAEAGEVIGILDGVINLIEERFKGMEQAGTKQTTKSHYYIVIDELADLMISEQTRYIKLKLQKILQIGRAAGVHIIAATQAPNRKIIPADVVLNFTNRLALRCISAIESRQIINLPGAEKLPKYGKGIYLSPDGVKEAIIPLSPDNSDLIEKWRKAPVAPAAPTYTPTKVYIPDPIYKSNIDPVSILKGIGIALIVLFIWACV